MKLQSISEARDWHTFFRGADSVEELYRFLNGDEESHRRKIAKEKGDYLNPYWTRSMSTAIAYSLNAPWNSPNAGGDYAYIVEALVNLNDKRLSGDEYFIPLGESPRFQSPREGADLSTIAARSRAYTVDYSDEEFDPATLGWSSGLETSDDRTTGGSSGVDYSKPNFQPTGKWVWDTWFEHDFPEFPEDENLRKEFVDDVNIKGYVERKWAKYVEPKREAIRQGGYTYADHNVATHGPVGRKGSFKAVAGYIMELVPDTRTTFRIIKTLGKGTLDPSKTYIVKCDGTGYCWQG